MTLLEFARAVDPSYTQVNIDLYLFWKEHLGYLEDEIVRVGCMSSEGEVGAYAKLGVLEYLTGLKANVTHMNLLFSKYPGEGESNANYH